MSAIRLSVEVGSEDSQSCRDIRMHAQASENDFVSAFRNQLAWLPKDNEVNPFVLWNPMRPIVFQYNKWRMERFIGKALDERFSSRPDKEVTNDSKTKCSRPIIDLALDAYHKEEGAKHTTTGIDATFKSFAMDQIKTFMFAGHDTTSSTISYIAYALSDHPEALRKVRQEYDEVFGTNVEQTPHLIKENPYLLNKLPYTVAIIKEILRLYPPASTVRKGLPGFSLHHDGKQYPTEGKPSTFHQIHVYRFFLYQSMSRLHPLARLLRHPTLSRSMALAQLVHT